MNFEPVAKIIALRQRLNERLQQEVSTIRAGALNIPPFDSDHVRDVREFANRFLHVDNSRNRGGTRLDAVAALQPMISHTIYEDINPVTSEHKPKTTESLEVKKSDASEPAGSRKDAWGFSVNALAHFLLTCEQHKERVTLKVAYDHETESRLFEKDCTYDAFSKRVERGKKLALKWLGSKLPSKSGEKKRKLAMEIYRLMNKESLDGKEKYKFDRLKESLGKILRSEGCTPEFCESVLSDSGLMYWQAKDLEKPEAN